MAYNTDFKYAGIDDLTKYFNRVDDFDSKRQVFPTETSGNNHFFRDVGYVNSFFVNGSEQASAQADFDNVNGDGQWCYRSDNNDLKFQASYYSSTTINEQMFEAGVDFTDFLEQALVDASLELHNYLDARYSTPIEKNRQVDLNTVDASGVFCSEYDPIIIKSVCYIAAANLIRAKEGASEEADYYMSQVTNAERQGIIDRLNDGILKLSNEVDANDKKGSIRYRSTSSGTMDLVELAGEYRGESYDLLKIEVEETGAYGVGSFKVWHFGDNKIYGAVTSAKTITGGLQHLFGGLFGRFQGFRAEDGNYWEIQVSSSERKQTNKSNATIEMTR
tara:strand:+ start:355 stop:1353 length:999 start_codon:yes stop_codon:yes gene_type:complete